MNDTDFKLIVLQLPIITEEDSVDEELWMFILIWKKWPQTLNQPFSEGKRLIAAYILHS